MSFEMWLVLYVIAKVIGVVLMIFTVYIGVMALIGKPEPKESTPWDRWIKGK
jgi:hypothetical protein